MVASYGYVIGEYRQSDQETVIAFDDGFPLIVEPGEYPVLTVISDAVANRIEHAAIVFDARNERGEVEQVLLMKTAEQLRSLARDGTVSLRVPESLLEPAAKQEWDVKQYPGFEFAGPTGNPALVDVSVLTRPGSTPTVIATERADNEGCSVTNGAEQLAAQVLTRLFPEHVGEDKPFRLVVHHRSASFAVGDRDFEALEPTIQEVRFADFRVRANGNGVPRIGDVVEWKNLDERVAEVLAEQTTIERAADDEPDAQVQRRSRGLHL